MAATRFRTARWLVAGISAAAVISGSAYFFESTPTANGAPAAGADSSVTATTSVGPAQTSPTSPPKPTPTAKAKKRSRGS